MKMHNDIYNWVDSVEAGNVDKTEGPFLTSCPGFCASRLSRIAANVFNFAL